MSSVFISYARSTESQARAIGEALRALGYDVWRDDELPAHRAYAEVIEERLKAAGAVVVVWSSEAVKSEWVRAEADAARERKTLVQLSVDGVVPPMPFTQIQCADMAGWSGDADAAGWRKVLASIAELVGRDPPAPAASSAAQAPTRKHSICVLPFANISGDPEQEYFSDGISEDIITDLSKVAALSVTARNTAFTFKGRAVRVIDVARELGVSHVLEGSVRKAGNRVRITAQLIDGAAGVHLWAERWDRDLDDIFAVQDEISEEIVGALRLKLLPQEKKAIERRGTESAEAYDLYLMARQHWAAGNEGNPRVLETIVHLTRRAVEIDAGYARAWALMAIAQITLQFRHGHSKMDGVEAMEKALALDPDLAEAHAARADLLRHEGRLEDALAEARIALHLDPESYEANRSTASALYTMGRFAEAVPHREKSAALMETDFGATAMLVSCHAALGDAAAARLAAKETLARAVAALARDRSNGSALAYGAASLAVLGETERARDWVRRALLIDPDNMTVRYNLACALSLHLGEVDGALDLLGPYLAQTTSFADVALAESDPDFDPIRQDPRFKAMLAEAEARLAAATQSSAARGA
ncbi:MAG: TIR domain-containing protein [Caulobacteraceae bacterium]